MKMFLFNREQEVKRWLVDRDFIEAKMTEQINTADKLVFSVPLKKRLPTSYFFAAIPQPRGSGYLLFKIVTEQVQSNRVQYTCVEAAYDELKSYHYIKDDRPQDRSAADMLQMALDGTRWGVGTTYDTGTGSTNFYYISSLEAVQKIASLFQLEVVFSVVLDPRSHQITRRLVNLYAQQGERTGKRFEYGSDLLSVEREESSENLITALIGRGKGEEVYHTANGETNEEDKTPDGYGRRINFADVVWSTENGNPVNKPAGQEYVEDPNATAAYGFDDGKPRIGIEIFEDITDPGELLKATWSALQTLKRPRVSFKANTLDVGDLGLGDTVAIIRHDIKIEYFTRVYKVEHNLLNEKRNTIELGDDFNSQSITSVVNSIASAVKQVSQTANYASFSSNGKNTNSYGKDKPVIAVEGDLWYKDLGNGEVDLYQYHDGNWVLITSTRDLHNVQSQVEKAQAGLNQAKSDIEANKAAADESLQKLHDSVTNLQGQYDNNIVPDLNKVTSDVADALQKYTTAQQNIADLTTQAQQQGKDIASVTSTANGLNLDFANLKGDVNSTKTDVQGLQATVGNATGDIAQLKVDASNLQALLAGKVDETTYTNFVSLTNQALAAKLTASDLNGYAKTTDVQATADGLKVNIDSVTDRMNNLKIGAVNQLRDTDPDGFSNTESDHTWTVESGGDGHGTVIDLDSNFSAKHGFGIIRNTGGNRDFNQHPFYWNGGKYVFTVFIRLAPETEQTNVTALIRAWNYTKNADSYVKNIAITSKEWQKFSMEIDSSTFYKDDCGFGFGITGAGSLNFAEPMLVTGNTPTDWAPAPEDVQNDLTQLSAQIKANSQQFSSYYTKSETDSKTDAAKNDAVNAIKGDANWTGLTNIITNSGFLQTADGFTQKVQQTTLPMVAGGGVNFATKTGESSLNGGNGTSAPVGYIPKKFLDENLGHQLTISIDVEWQDYQVTSTGKNRIGAEVAIHHENGAVTWFGTWLQPSASNGKQRISTTYTLPTSSITNTGDLTVYGYVQIQCTSAKLANLKVEKGVVATPWTPNPADLATQVAVSELTQTVNGLQSTVSGNYGDLQSQISQTAKTIRGEVTDKVTGLQNQITTTASDFNVSLSSLRKETAWQKVTAPIDANDYKTTGNYWIQATSNTNTPDGSAWAYLQVVAYPDVQRVKQTWQRDNDGNQAYTRLLVSDGWTAWQKTVTDGNIMAQINMSAGTTLIQNNKIYMDAASTVFSGSAFIPSAAITSLEADKITTGTLNAGEVNIINMNADNITTGTITGQNLKINLNSGEILFQHGRITSTLGTLNINVDTGVMSVTDSSNNGVYFVNGEMKLQDDPLNVWGTPKYGGIRRSSNLWSTGTGGMELHSPNGVVMSTDNYDGAFAGGGVVDGATSGAAFGVDKNGNAEMNGSRSSVMAGGKNYTGSGFDIGGRPYIQVGASPNGDINSRITISGEHVHIPSAYFQTTSSGANLVVAGDGALVRSTSASKYKTAITRSHSLDYGERLLSLPTATWFDKAEEKRFASGESKSKPVKYFGMIAEDLADAGLEMLVSRGQDGELEGIQYDRITPALLPVIKSLQDRITKLEEQLNGQ